MFPRNWYHDIRASFAIVIIRQPWRTVVFSLGSNATSAKDMLPTERGGRVASKIMQSGTFVGAPVSLQREADRAV